MGALSGDQMLKSKSNFITTRSDVYQVLAKIRLYNYPSIRTEV